MICPLSTLCARVRASTSSPLLSSFYSAPSPSSACCGCPWCDKAGLVPRLLPSQLRMRRRGARSSSRELLPLSLTQRTQQCSKSSPRSIPLLSASCSSSGSPSAYSRASPPRSRTQGTMSGIGCRFSSSPCTTSGTWRVEWQEDICATVSRRVWSSPSPSSASLSSPCSSSSREVRWHSPRSTTSPPSLLWRSWLFPTDSRRPSS
mmetsp:Transcript_14482/g.33284  ORF Transcript_14482/g.33284 Transcript_14482/m.33284 type:complete len:205 (-) Transcript_14482:125-739(-)